MPVKISELELKPVLDGTEQVEINDAGVTKKATTAGIAALASGGSTGGVQSVTGTLVDDTDPDNPVINSQDLASVLAEGNDAGGLGITNIQSIESTTNLGENTKITLNKDSVVIQYNDTNTPLQFSVRLSSGGLIASIDASALGAGFGNTVLGLNTDGFNIIYSPVVGGGIARVSGSSDGLGFQNTIPGVSISMIDLPTSPSGLASGSLWRNGNVVNIVP